MKDNDKKPNGDAPEPAGRAFGKYRLINDDEMPLLHDDGREEESEGKPAPKEREKGPERGRRDEASRAERRGDERGDSRRAEGEYPEERTPVRGRPRRQRPPVLSIGRDLDYEPPKRGAAEPGSSDGPVDSNARRGLGRGLPTGQKASQESSAAQRRSRVLGPPPRPEADQAESGPPPKKSRESGARKGSCPSWLKSRVYKGGRPGKDDKGLLELQELIIRYSPVGTAVLDNRGRVRIRNESFMEFVGLDVEETVQDIEEVSELLERPIISEKFWDAVESGSTVEVEEEVDIGSDERMPIRVAFSPVSLPSGMNWCICYFEMASGRDPRGVEPRVEEPRGGLYEYKDYVAQMAASSGDAIIGLDNKGSIKYWNHGAQAVFGYADDEILGKHVGVLIPEELRREAQLVHRVVYEKGIYRNFDTHRLDKSGERIPVTMTISAVKDDDGRVIGTASTCKDLRSAKELHEKSLEAEKLNAVLQMAISIYHQINNPLCVISANAQLLLPKFAEADSEEAEKLKIIIAATKRVNTVLEDLTRLTGIEPRTPKIKKEEKPAA